MATYSFSTIDELGQGYGFRRVREPLGIEAFGSNVLVMPPGFEGFDHYHDTQDELYFVHSGTARIDVDGSESRVVGPGGLFHCQSTVHRRVSNAGDSDLVVLIVGAKGGRVERDGHLVDPERDGERRANFGK